MKNPFEYGGVVSGNAFWGVLGSDTAIKQSFPI
jgi:hypothetical protein